MKAKRLQFGRVEFAIAMPDEDADRITRSAPYRYLLRPALDLMRSRRIRNGHTNGAAASRPAPAAAPSDPEAQAVVDRIGALTWYHTIELPHGVATPGFVDHREQLPLYGLPDDMRGMRALDVATYDGYWAFEMERRGADVVAIDIGSWAEFDIPRAFQRQAIESGAAEKITGRGFALARDILGSRVTRHVLSVYELSPEKLGTFDVVFLSDLLLHLRDPQRALENVCSVVNERGCAIVGDVYSDRLERFGGQTLSEFVGFGEYVWWMPSTATLKSMMKLAGFARVEELARFQLAASSESPIHKVVLKGYQS